MSIDLKTYTGGTITATDDAVTYDILCGGECGVIHGCNVTGLTGTNQISIASGRMLIKGRLISIEEETMLVPLNASGTTTGELYVRMDLGNDANKIELIASNSKHELVQDEDCNITNGVYEYRLAEFDVGTTVVTNVQTVFQPIDSIRGDIAEINNRITDLHNKHLLFSSSSGLAVGTVITLSDEITNYSELIIVPSPENGAEINCVTNFSQPSRIQLTGLFAGLSGDALSMYGVVFDISGNTLTVHSIASTRSSASGVSFAQNQTMYTGGFKVYGIK